jgi:hypothetical protein
MDISIYCSIIQTNAVTWFAIQTEGELGMFPCLDELTFGLAGVAGDC